MTGRPKGPAGSGDTTIDPHGIRCRTSDSLTIIQHSKSFLSLAGDATRAQHLPGESVEPVAPSRLLNESRNAPRQALPDVFRENRMSQGVWGRKNHHDSVCCFAWWCYWNPVHRKRCRRPALLLRILSNSLRAVFHLLAGCVGCSSSSCYVFSPEQGIWNSSTLNYIALSAQVFRFRLLWGILNPSLHEKSATIFRRIWQNQVTSDRYG